MATKSLKTIQQLKASTLQSMLLSIGSKKSGVKSILAERLHKDLVTPKLTPQHGKAPGQVTHRILSIDMGVKNMAYCITDVQIPHGGQRIDDTPPSFKVIEWKRLNIVDPNARTTSSKTSETPLLSEFFAPQNLAPVAVRLVDEEFLPHKPSAILIERQRFRSGGGPSVQEWTLRVNMLESMLWASLITMQRDHSDQNVPPVDAVSPANVASFWFPGQRKVEKQHKIKLVKSWLSGSVTESPVSVTFAPHLANIKAQFVGEEGRKSGKGKLDDLADCLLQAAAWARWETNRAWISDCSERQWEEYVTTNKSKPAG